MLYLIYAYKYFILNVFFFLSNVYVISAFVASALATVGQDGKGPATFRDFTFRDFTSKIHVLVYPLFISNKKVKTFLFQNKKEKFPKPKVVSK